MSFTTQVESLIVGFLQNIGTLKRTWQLKIKDITDSLSFFQIHIHLRGYDSKAFIAVCNSTYVLLWTNISLQEMMQTHLQGSFLVFVLILQGNILFNNL